jgi:flavin-binding protein dodecin
MVSNEQAAAIEAAVERANDSLELLERVPVANTATARTAMSQTRLTVLERFHEEITEALGEAAATA